MHRQELVVYVPLLFQYAELDDGTLFLLTFLIGKRIADGVLEKRVKCKVTVN